MHKSLSIARAARSAARTRTNLFAPRAVLLALVVAGVGGAAGAGAFSVVTEPARDVTSSSAMLAGSVTSEGASAFWFEWGTNQSYGQLTPVLRDGPATGESATTRLTDLAPEIVYHYRAVASNSAGLAFGSNQTFRTAYFTPLRFPYGANWRASLAWGDYDGDDDLDLAYASYGHGPSSEGGLLRNNGGSLGPISDTIPAYYRDQVSWGDYDNDGDIDLFLATSRPVLLRNDGGGLTTAALDFPFGGPSPTVAWADFDNDGDLDLFGGAIGTNMSLTDGRIFSNDRGRLSSVPMNVVFPGIQHRGASWIDYNNNGYSDLALATGTGFQLWSNTNGIFTRVEVGLSDLMAGSFAWADYDQDGDVDLFITASLPTHTGLYRNDNGVFARVSAGIPPLMESGSFSSWGDLDNDGDPDLVVSGRLAPPLNGYHLQVYRNDAGSLTPAGTAMQGIVDGEAQWGDFDGDGDLDLVALGRRLNSGEGLLYRNENARSNSPPSAPTGVTGRLIGSNSLVISWDASADAETPSVSLTYNLRVGTTPGGCEIMSPHANPATGFRLVPALGNVGFRRSHTLTNLPPAKAYYFSVQAVDAGFAGSPFSARGTVALAPVIESIHRFGPVLAVQGHGPPGIYCNLYISTNLVTWRHPLGVWVDTNGFWEYWDPDGPARGASFYRVTLPDE